MINRALLFGTGFLQVSLVTAQTYMISRTHIAGILVVGFLISFVWTINVKKIAFGGWVDRVIYSSDASIGALAGLFTKVFVKE